MINVILEKIKAAEADAAAIAQKAVIRVQLIETDTRNKIEAAKNEAAEELVKKIKKLTVKKQAAADDEAEGAALVVGEAQINEARKFIIDEFKKRYAP